MSYHYVAGSDIIANRFLQGARIHELLHQNPHSNVVNYRGCVLKGSKIVGLAMKRYQSTLSDRQASYGGETLDKAACFRGIMERARHLHSLGVAHNDINPSNIMLDEHGRPIIIDLGSCKPFGVELTELGTPGWNEGFDDISSATNDNIALKKIQEWLGIEADQDMPGTGKPSDD